MVPGAIVPKSCVGLITCTSTGAVRKRGPAGTDPRHSVQQVRLQRVVQTMNAETKKKVSGEDDVLSA